jgi:hypothetical protein
LKQTCDCNSLAPANVPSRESNKTLLRCIGRALQDKETFVRILGRSLYNSVSFSYSLGTQTND